MLAQHRVIRACKALLFRSSGTASYTYFEVIVKRALAEGDMVVLHCHQIWPEGSEYAGMDIFRLDANGKVVEHWDVLQEMPKTSKHDNGMF